MKKAILFLDPPIFNIKKRSFKNGKCLTLSFLLFRQFSEIINITIDILILIAVLLAMVVLFMLEVLPMEVTAMGAIGVLLLFDTKKICC